MRRYCWFWHLLLDRRLVSATAKVPKRIADVVSTQGVEAVILTVLLETARMETVPHLEHRRKHR